MTLYKPEMVVVADLAGASYNPRRQIPERMEMLKFSLVKLGFVLPIYATKSGHLLSGHQRMTTARNIGCTHVPVVRVDLSEAEFKTINLVFNRATNDMRSDETSENMFDRLQGHDLKRIINGRPDRDPLSDTFFRAVKAEQVPTESLLDLTTIPYDPTAIPLARTLVSTGIHMPVVAVRGGKMINGNYRAFAAVDLLREGRKGLDTWPVVWIEPEEEELATLLVNMVSMQFSVEDQHADFLRFGSFRRAQNITHNLTRAVRFWADGCRFLSAIHSLKEPRPFWHRWRTEHGSAVCDFGAGQRRNSIILRQKGVTCIDFEPYAVPWDLQDHPDKSVPDLDLSRKVTDTFLASIETGIKFDSIFLSAVLNSVPFHKDRIRVLACVHGLCSFGTTVYGATRSIQAKRIGDFRPQTHINGGKGASATIFEVEYEKDVVLGDLANNPKVQKYMKPPELRAMLELFWLKVEIWDGPYLAFRCSAPKRIEPTVLAEAIAFEFDLPYPGDKKLGRADAALAAYGKRHGVPLTL